MYTHIILYKYFQLVYIYSLHIDTDTKNSEIITTLQS